MRDYYCNRKFFDLKIDLEKQTTYSCCKALPNLIDLEFLKNNPGAIFNSTELQKERQMMLENKRVKSCENACWQLEEKGQHSFRLDTNGNLKSHTDIKNNPEVLDVTLLGECNLTCTYCCKEFSSAWRQDLLKNGDYTIDETENRYKLSAYDIALSKVSQKEKRRLEFIKILENEIAIQSKNIKAMTITGGEPFLYYNFENFIDSVKTIPKIKIITGLGVNFERLKKILNVLKKYPNIELRISGETTGAFYEFNRYGNTWSSFVNSIELIRSLQIKYRFLTTYSNLTVLDFVNFNSFFTKEEKDFNTVSYPDFMKIHVLDDSTKYNLIKEIKNSSFSNYQSSNHILNFLQEEPTAEQKQNLEIFLKEFSKRRAIDLTFLPSSFRKWVNLD